MNLTHQSPPLDRWLPRNQWVLLVVAALLGVVMFWFYVDLLHEQVQRGKTVRESWRALPRLPADARGSRLLDVKGREALRLGSGTAEAMAHSVPWSTP